ncbi:MAG: AAA family ATPase [Candidatus Thermoplasmatota archaeon]|nr:AAA family ATPase [Candidatus Thermoplasmatota archaeon]
MGFFSNRRAQYNLNQQIHNTEYSNTNQTVDIEKQNNGKTLQFETVDPIWKLSDLILPQETVDAISHAANTILVSPIIEKWLGNIDKAGNRIAVNFYGPPGTGKTSAAEALATILSLKMVKINYAELESRFVGGTPKNIQAAFRYAQEVNALLFFDEADSILSQRFTNLTQANEAYINQTRSTMMIELNHFSGIVVFATNLQSNYDDAFVRRIAAHIQFQLPDITLRKYIWEKYLPDTLPQNADVSISQLSTMSEGFSPADIAIAVRKAAVRAAIREEHDRKVNQSDFKIVIDQIKKAQLEVGNKQRYTMNKNTETVMPYSEVPEELKYN